ncbi:MAG: methyltransferase, partial [Bacteroidota bacterium]|nr:methyltransferase [Bacteroidota bacterium]
MEISSSSINKWLYALLFLVIIPVVLWFWAVSTESLIRFPAIKSIQAGIILAASGISLMAWGMYAIKKQGKGLPMNAFPPPKFVNRGPYRIFHHPIYVGFGLLMAGVFIWKGSASGLWMVTPCTIFGMVALVWGYEKPDLEKRFPGEALITVLHFPENRFL